MPLDISMEVERRNARDSEETIPYSELCRVVHLDKPIGNPGLVAQRHLPTPSHDLGLIGENNLERCKMSCEHIMLTLESGARCLSPARL